MSAPSPARDADDARSPVAVTPEPTTTSRDADAAADDDARARTPTTLAASFDAMTLRDRTNDATTRETKHARASSLGGKRFHSPTDSALSPASKFVARKAHHATIAIADKSRAAPRPGVENASEAPPRSRFAPS